MCRGVADGGRRCPSCLDRNKKSSYDRASYAASAAAVAMLKVDESLIPQLSAIEVTAAVNSYSNLPNVSEITELIAGTKSRETILVTPSTLKETEKGDEFNQLGQETGRRILEGFSCKIILDGGRTLTVEATGTRIYCEEWTFYVNGTISLDGELVGRWERSFEKLRGNGEKPEAHYDYLMLRDKVQGQRLGQKLLTHFDTAVLAMGIRRVKIEANLDVGGYAWAKAGYDWDSDPDSPEAKLMPWVAKDNHYLQHSLALVIKTKGDPSGEIKKMITRLNQPYSPSYPTPLELAMLGREQAAEANGQEMWVGKKIMLATTWYGSRTLS